MERLRQHFRQGGVATPQTTGAKIIHLSEWRARAYLRRMKENGEIYVATWHRRGNRGNYAPCYIGGRGDDAPKPKKEAAPRRRVSRRQQEKALAA